MVKFTLVFLGSKQAQIQKILARKGLKQKFKSWLPRLENVLAGLCLGRKKQARPTSSDLFYNKNPIVYSNDLVLLRSNSSQMSTFNL